MKKLLALVLLTSVIGCRAGDEVKQGVQGEFCEASDADCRQGYICDRGYCRLQSIVGTDCNAMCQRIESCGQIDENCLADCQATFTGDCSADLPCQWSDNAVNAFGSCIVNDLSCDAIASGDGPQICYSALTLPAERQAVCDEFLAVMEACNANDTTGLLNRCYQLGRTATDTSFTRTNTCSELSAEGLCFETADCLNAIFVLDPPLEVSP